MVRDSLVRDEPAGGSLAVARVPQLDVGVLQGVDGHTEGYYRSTRQRWAFILFIIFVAEE